MDGRCAHCSEPIEHARTGRPHAYCSHRCGQRARRRRHAGIAENAYPSGARRGQVPLGTPTRAEVARARVAEILAARPAA